MSCAGWIKRTTSTSSSFLCSWLACCINNLTLIVGMDASAGEKLSIFMGRFLTHLFLVSAVCLLLVELSMRSAPKYLRWGAVADRGLGAFLGDCRSAARGDVEQDIARRGQCLDGYREIGLGGGVRDQRLGHRSAWSVAHGGGGAAICLCDLRSCVTGFRIDIKHVCPWASLSCLLSLAGSVFWPNRASGQHGNRSQ